jgi:hypothetical protein
MKFAAAREYKKQAKRTYDEACAMYEKAKTKFIERLDSDSEEDPSFSLEKIQKKDNN